MIIFKKKKHFPVKDFQSTKYSKKHWKYYFWLPDACFSCILCIFSEASPSTLAGARWAAASSRSFWRSYYRAAFPPVFPGEKKHARFFLMFKDIQYLIWNKMNSWSKSKSMWMFPKIRENPQNGWFINNGKPLLIQMEWFGGVLTHYFR